ncbi:MAG: hypothetical protein AABW54_01595 [Candidatus Micrarchaeota archaeon]
MKCERCGKDAYYAEECDYCNKKVCRNCHKASATASKTSRKVICKGCWSNMPKRKKFKSA